MTRSKLGAAEQRLRVERRGVRLREGDARGEPGARGRSGRGRQHFPRDVEAEQPSLRIGPRQFDEIAPGAAGDLQHLVAGSGPKARDRLVAAEEIEFAAQVIDVALTPIHAVHQRRGVAHGSGAFERVEVEGAVDRRPILPAKLAAQLLLVAPRAEHVDRARGRATDARRRRCGRSPARPAARCG